MKRRLPMVLLPVFAVLAVGAALYPIHDTVSKFAALAGAMGTALTLTALVWRRRRLRIGLGLVFAAIVLVFCLPARLTDTQALRNRYVSNLRSYEGARYVWGGEGGRGIDCSGLPRRAYRDAMLIEGLRTLNGALTRSWLDQWWHDVDARGMGEGAAGRLVELPSPDTWDSPEDLQAGDIAVVNQNTHVVVYLGGGAWIEADPELGKVIVHEAQPDGRPWLGKDPKLLRWRELIRHE